MAGGYAALIPVCVPALLTSILENTANQRLQT